MMNETPDLLANCNQQHELLQSSCYMIKLLLLNWSNGARIAFPKQLMVKTWCISDVKCAHLLHFHIRVYEQTRSDRSLKAVVFSPPSLKSIPPITHTFSYSTVRCSRIHPVSCSLQCYSSPASMKMLLPPT